MVNLLCIGQLSTSCIGLLASQFAGHSYCIRRTYNCEVINVILTCILELVIPLSVGLLVITVIIAVIIALVMVYLVKHCRGMFPARLLVLFCVIDHSGCITVMPGNMTESLTVP